MRRRWFKIGKGVAVGVGSLSALFALLIVTFNAQIVGTSDVCAGTLEDPCVSFINVTMPAGLVVDVYNQDEVRLDFSPEIKDYALFRKDGRCSGKKGSACCSPEGVCFKGWNFIDFTEDTKPRKDKKYVFRFEKTKSFLLYGLKNSPEDTVKWGFKLGGLLGNYLDPEWSGVGNTSVVGNHSVDGSVFWNFTSISSDNRSSVRVRCRAYDLTNYSRYWNDTS